MAVKYKIEYDTQIGSRISYILNILDTSYTGVTPLPAIPGTEPFAYEVVRGDDPYVPIKGSTATITLKVNNQAEYEDFNSFPEFTYEVRLDRTTSTATATETLTATSASNSNSVRANLFLSNADRVLLFGLSNPGVAYTETDADIPTTVDITVAGLTISAGTNIRYNSTRASIRGSFSVPQIASGATFVVSSMGGEGLETVWNGWISPIDGTELVDTFPFEIQLTATDGLGLIGERSVGPLLDRETPVIKFIQDALITTGLGMDLYVDSGITNSTGDALVGSTVNEFAFYNDDQTEKLTQQEILEGILTSFNCVLLQSHGAWYVYNASTHKDEPVWHFYMFDASTTPDSFGSATVQTGANTVVEIRRDLVPQGGDFQLNTRHPKGSVEATFPDLTRFNAIPNGLFNEETGWIAGPDSLDSGVAYSDDVTKGDNSIITTRLVDISARGGEHLWFTNEVGRELNYLFPHELSFRTRMNAPAVNGIIGVQVIVRFFDEMGAPVTFDATNVLTGNPSTTLNDRAIFNFAKGYWNYLAVGTDSLSENANHTYIAELGNAQGSWFDFQQSLIRLAPRRSTVGGNRPDLPPNGQLYVVFTYPEGRDGNNDIVSGSGATLVDNISISPSISTELASPTHERVQANYAETLDYQPLLVSEQEGLFYQELNSNQFWRDGESEVNAEVGGALEEVISQQKLNDWRGGLGADGGAPFKYYEGVFINLQTTPFAPINKPLVNYSWTDSNGNPRTYIETSAGIFNGGEFKTRANTVDMAFYIPNQTTDVASTFNLFNTDLFPAPAPDRVIEVVYAVGLRIIGRDDNMNPILTADVNNVAPGGAGYITTTATLTPDGVLHEPNLGSIVIENEPGHIEEGSFIIEAAAGIVTADGTQTFQVGSSSLTVTDTGTTPAPSNLEVLSIINLSSTTAQVKYRATVPDETTYEILEITGEADPITENTVSFEVTVESTDGAGNIALTTLPVSGEAGSLRTFQSVITPDNNRQLLANNFAFTFLNNTNSNTPPGAILMNSGVLERGSGLEWSLSVLIPNTAPTTNPIARVTNVDDEPRDSTQEVTLMLDIREVSGGITNLDVPTTNIPITGLPGESFVHHIPVSPAPGFMLDESNDRTAATINGAASDVVKEDIQDGSGYLIPVVGNVFDGTVVIIVDYSGAVQRLDADVVSNTVTFTTTGLNMATLDEAATETPSGGRNTSGTNRFKVIPIQSKRFTSLAQLTTLTATGSVSLVAGGTVLESDGSITVRYLNTFTDESIAGLITVAGTPVDKQFLLTVNLDETLPQGKLSTTSLTTRFDTGDTVKNFTGITIMPTEGSMAYLNVSQADFTLPTGVTTNNLAISGGNIIFDLSIVISAGADGDLAHDVSITPGGAPPSSTSTRIQLDTFGLRNCTVTINGSSAGFVDIPFSTSNQTIAVVATRISSATFNRTGMNTPVFATGVDSPNSGTQSDNSFTFTTTLTPKTVANTEIIRLTGGADVDAETINGFDFAIGTLTDTETAPPNRITLVPISTP